LGISEEAEPMSTKLHAALTADQWAARDYRQPAGELDHWAKHKPAQRPEDDSTEYVAKLGLSYDDCVIVMNRAHERVLVPPPARAALAAFAIAGQPFGFTREDAELVRRAADALPDGTAREALHAVADRLDAILPPADV
jgi:hypothetical protein